MKTPIGELSITVLSRDSSGLPEIEENSSGDRLYSHLQLEFKESIQSS